MRAWQAHEMDMREREDKIRMRQQEFMQKMALQEQDAQMNRAERDLKLGADLASKRAKLNGAAA